MLDNEKKSKKGLIIIIVIVLLLILFGIWFFLLRDKDSEGPKEETSVPADNTAIEYNYTDGVLTRIVDEDGNPLQNDFVIDGVILVGNRHSYEELEADSEGIMEKLVKQGYKKDGINSSFYLNEYIEFYLDTKYNGSVDDVKIYITPHRKIEEYQKITITELFDLADEEGAIIEYNQPDEEQYKYVGNGYVSLDYPEGKYDILFMYQGKLAYFININLTKEIEE